MNRYKLDHKVIQNITGEHASYNGQTSHVLSYHTWLEITFRRLGTSRTNALQIIGHDQDIQASYFFRYFPLRVLFS